MRTGLETAPTKSLLALIARGEDAIAKALPRIQDAKVAEGARTVAICLEPIEAELRKRGAWVV